MIQPAVLFIVEPALNPGYASAIPGSINKNL